MSAADQQVEPTALELNLVGRFSQADLNDRVGRERDGGPGREGRQLSKLIRGERVDLDHLAQQHQSVDRHGHRP